jgi:hypothetical protein
MAEKMTDTGYCCHLQLFGYRVTLDVMITSGNRQWPLSEFHQLLPVTVGTEMTVLAGKGQEIFEATVFAFHAGKAVVHVTAVPVSEDDSDGRIGVWIECNLIKILH